MKELFLYSSISYPVVREIETFDRLLSDILDALGRKFAGKTIHLCGIGTSGAMFITGLMLHNKKFNLDLKPMLLRKGNESTHRGELGGVWASDFNEGSSVIVVVDDLMSSGNTMSNIASMLEAHYLKQYVRCVSVRHSHNGENSQQQLNELFPSCEFIIR